LEVPRACEGVKKSQNEQKHLAQRRKGAEAEKKKKDLFNSKSLRLRVSARDCLFSHSFSRPLTVRAKMAVPQPMTPLPNDESPDRRGNAGQIIRRREGSKVAAEVEK